MDVPANPAALAMPSARGHSAGLLRRVAPYVVAPVLPFLVFAPALIGRILLAPDDGHIFYLPLHELAARAIRAGQLPSWNPWDLSGAPLLADQAGIFYPLNAFFLMLPTVIANNLYVIVNLAIGGLGASLFARQLTRDRAASAVAGVAFVSSGFAYGHIAHQGVLAGAVWLPWVLLGYERLSERPTVGRLILTSLPLALSALAGHPQMFFVIVLTVAIYGLGTSALRDPKKARRIRSFALLIGAAAAIEIVLPATPFFLVFFMIFFAGLALRAVAAGAKRARTARRLPPRALLLLGGVVVVGIGIAAIQLLPTAAVAGQTVRSQADVATATSYSFSGSHLILLLFPYLFGNSYSVFPFSAVYDGQWNLTELAGYPGLAALVFAAVGFPRIRRDPRALAVGLAGLIALLIALGRSTGVGALFAFVPAYGQFRSWGRYSVVLDLAIAIFAAYGVAHLRSSGCKEWRVARMHAWLVVAVIAALGLLVPFVPAVHRYVPGGREQALAIGLPLIAAALAATTIALFPRYARAAVIACCLLVALDGALSFGAFFEWRHSPTPAAVRSLYSPRTETVWGTVPPAPGGFTRYLFAAKSPFSIYPAFPRATDLKGLRSVNGYGPLVPRRYSEALGGLRDFGGIDHPRRFFRMRPWLLDVLRVSLVLVPERAAPHRTPAWFDSAVRKGGFVRYAYTPRVPTAYVIGKVEAVSGREALALTRTAQFDPRQSAFVEGTCRPCSHLSHGGLVGAVTHSVWGNGSITMEVDARRRALLVLSQSWFPGWTASVDGRSAPVVRTDAVVSGVPIPAGRHHVVLRYRPPGLTAGIAVSGLTTGASALLALYFVIRKRRRQEPSSHPTAGDA